MELQTTHGQQLTQIQYSPKQIELGKQVRRLSLAGNPSFPIPDAFIIDYIQNIEEQAPDITPAILQKIVNKMLTGKLPYDVNKGIRNIFEGIETYKKYRIRFKIYDTENDVGKEVNEDSELHNYDKSIWIAFDGGYSLSSPTVPTIQNFGFTVFDEDTIRSRKEYLEHLEGAEPISFVKWWHEFTAKREAYRQRMEAQAQERLERVNSEAERRKKELSDKLARKSIDW